ncbi:HTH domain-containing protein [Flammeovirga sp. MY04]|uniref:HTH domain-containing protein n=1 Tax=Flammeovirga sp. MY04 TaxID=1191459 RepID=UPI000806166C|nr:HTH domain-containing protein [Flammeovirga sp. MY04]ANQ50920.1 HTH domain-containing protein [Flammeovirga sp. MY04]
MKLQEQLLRIKRIDDLIRRKATGTPQELATKMDISDRTLRNLISMMKDMGAEIHYDQLRGSYTYTRPFYFFFGFYHEDMASSIAQYKMN